MPSQSDCDVRYSRWGPLMSQLKVNSITHCQNKLIQEPFEAGNAQVCSYVAMLPLDSPSVLILRMPPSPIV